MEKMKKLELQIEISSEKNTIFKQYLFIYMEPRNRFILMKKSKEHLKIPDHLSPLLDMSVAVMVQFVGQKIRGIQFAFTPI
jgi:hypothetical protein